MTNLIEQYAKALTAVAMENDCVETIDQEVSSLLQLMRDNKMADYLSSLAFSQEDKAGLVRLLQESSSAYLKNFLEVILQNKREAYLLPILEMVLERLARARQVFDVSVISASPLSASQKENMLRVAREKFAIDTRQLIETIDPTLIGGFVLKANNQIIDTSIRRQLQDFKTNLK
ncbi:F0F1 ATP synthase subunit delta [Streptococcus cuniculipharyngis]|uniref:ATP synthase subunit delta n=1 Tax=Streptococcus cuniculipharyngis TaxID=1562651 RepID=A0A5C5SDY8_9STRE|nr:F0F1 ATP synthase subunit delta [Streptococcus cuniculipharyngis]TWS98732.1 F0F1 ATP synthase subunit delta [Streptococcus cuniculipharyngis]